MLLCDKNVLYTHVHETMIDRFGYLSLMPCLSWCMIWLQALAHCFMSSSSSSSDWSSSWSLVMKNEISRASATSALQSKILFQRTRINVKTWAPANAFEMSVSILHVHQSEVDQATVHDLPSQD